MTDNSTLARRSAHALGWNWAGALLRAVVQFVVQVVLARLLGPEAFGQAAAALLVIGLAGLVAEAGLGSALVQREPLSDADVSVALGWIGLISIGVAGGVAWASPWIAAQLGDPALRALVLASACIVPLHALAALPAGLLQRSLRARRLQAIQLGAYVLAYGVLGIGLALAGAGAWALLAAFAAHAMLVIAFGWIGLRHPLRPRLRGAPAMRAYGWRITAANLVHWALESVDRLAASRFWGAVPLGEYAAAAGLARAPVALLVGAAQPVAFASAARLQGQDERVARGYLAVLSLGLLLTVPLYVYLAWHAALIVALLYGPGWAGAAPLLAWLCLSAPFFVMLALTGPMLRGVDAVGGETRAQALVLVLFIAALGWAVGQPLTVVAMIVAATTALRAALLYLALGRRVALPAWAWLRILAAPLVLGGVVALACAGGAWLAPAQATLAALASAALALATAALLMRIAGRWLLPAELVQALDNRRQDSRVAAWACRFARLC